VISVRSLATELKNKPFPVLTRHFFNRLFQNDIFPFEEQMKEKIIILLAMVASLGWLIANSLFFKYVFIEDKGESWVEKCHFLAFFMIFLAFAAVLEWDVLFLDKRDYANLMVLPVRTATVFYAKSSSMFVFILFYSAAVSSLSFLVVAFVLPGWISNSLSMLWIYFIAHLISATAAFIFVFLLLVFIEAVLLVLLSPKLFKAFSLFVRFLLLVACIFFLMMFLVNRDSAQTFFSNLSDMKNRGDTSILLFPPMWFAGIYETMLGRHDPLYSASVYIGVSAILFLGLAYLLALALSYRKHIRKSLEVQARSVWFKKTRGLLGAAFDSMFLRNPVQRAVFHFFGKTLRNSPLHKVHLAGYLAFAFGFILVLLGAQHDALRNLTVANINLLAMPLVLAFFLLVGLRSIVNVPLSVEANWMFRLTESESRKHYFIGLKKAIFFFTLVPLFAALYVFYAVVWGAWPALLHVLYGFSFAILLREILFWKYPRIPFSCLTVPGKARIQYFWFLYGLAFLLSVSLLSMLERSFFGDPWNFVYYYAISLALILGLAGFQRFFVYEKIQIRYEEEPESVMVTLTKA